jgi:hypothetical protein
MFIILKICHLNRYISGISRISQSDTFKPKADDINDINTWGLGGDAHAQSSSQSYNVNPLLTDPTRYVCHNIVILIVYVFFLLFNV